MLHTLRGITEMTRLLGATSVLAGIQPEVAFAMAQLGLRLTGTTTALDLEEALVILANHERFYGGAKVHAIWRCCSREARRVEAQILMARWLDPDGDE